MKTFRMVGAALIVVLALGGCVTGGAYPGGSGGGHSHLDRH